MVSFGTWMKDNTFLVYDFVVHVSESTVWYGLYGSCKRWYHLVRDCISIRAMIYDGIIGDGTCSLFDLCSDETQWFSSWEQHWYSVVWSISTMMWHVIESWETKHFNFVQRNNDTRLLVHGSNGTCFRDCLHGLWKRLYAVMWFIGEMVYGCLVWRVMILGCFWFAR